MLTFLYQNQLFSQSSSGREAGIHLGIYRSCGKTEERYIAYAAESASALAGAQVARARGGQKGKLTLACYRPVEFLDYARLGVAQVELGRDEMVEVRRLEGNFAELHFLEPIRVTATHGPAATESVGTTIAIVGTANALSMIPLREWEKEWGKEAVDAQIDREILWFALSGDENPRVDQQASVGNFAALAPFALATPDISRRFEGKPVLQSLAAFLQSYPLEKLDYLVLVKESWSPSLSGIEQLDKQLKRLRPEAHFDVLSTKTITSDFGYLSSLATGREGGRYFESGSSERIEVPEQDLGGRVLGKIRTRARAKARERGIEIDVEPVVTETVTVRLDEAKLEVGNLITPDQLAEMRSVFELVLCLAAGDREERRLGLLSAISRAGLAFAEEQPVRELFRRWFSGFELPRESPIAEASLGELVIQAATPDGKAFLEGLLRNLRRLPAADSYCRIFVPSELFLASDK